MSIFSTAAAKLKNKGHFYASVSVLLTHFARTKIREKESEVGR